MNWTQISLILNALLAIILVIRLVGLGLWRVYGVFTALLVFEALSDLVVTLLMILKPHVVWDYRILWLAVVSVRWILVLWTTLALLQRILKNYPGILRMSTWIFNLGLSVVVLVSLITARGEYIASGGSSYGEFLARLVIAGLVFERVISTVCLLILLTILLFILLFPLQLPRNLIRFSIGFILYFAVKSSVLLIRSYFVHANFAVVDFGTSAVLCGCLLYWICFVNKEGETAPAAIVNWQLEEQVRLLGHLESLNSALLRSARR